MLGHQPPACLCATTGEFPKYEQIKMGFLEKPNLRLEEEAVPMGLVSFDTSAPAWLVWLYI